MRLTLILLAALPIWAQTQIVTGGTSKVTGGTQVAQSGTAVVFGGTTVVGGGGGPTAVWTQVQDKWGTAVTSGTTLTVTLNAAPTVGNLVVCYMGAFPRQGPTSVQDNAAHTYALTASSPSLGGPTNIISTAMAYLVAPAGAGTTVTATVGTALTAASLIACTEFHKSAGTPALDVDGAGFGGSPTINTPSVTVSAAGDLLVVGVYASNGCSAYNSPWVRWVTASPNGNYCAAYVLSASAGSNAPNISTSGAYNSILGAFK